MTIASLKNQVKRQRSDAFAAARPGAKVNKPRAELVMPGRFDAAEMPRLDAFDDEFGQDPPRYSARTTTQDEGAVVEICQCRAGCERCRRARLGLADRGWAAAPGPPIGSRDADIAANPRRFGRGNR